MKSKIFVKTDLFAKIPKILKTEFQASHYIVITDEKVKKLYGMQIISNLRREGLKCSLVSFPASETSKNWKIAAEICEKLAELAVKRDALIIALGGGVVSDVAGFVASIYMRGISYINIPTTLLAMVDAGLGGKTGIDLEAGKNLVGTFYQPKTIFIDPNFLKTLPSKEFKNGLAEIVKHAVIASRNLFLILEKNAKKLTPENISFLTKIITQNIRIKSYFVSRDEKESLKHKKISRMFLNYGHTIGHAIEKIENYKIPHGEAVAIGMVLENRIAVNKGWLKKEEALRIKALLKKIGLPVSLASNITVKNIDAAVKADKKFVGGKLVFCLPLRIGKAKLFTLD